MDIKDIVTLMASGNMQQCKTTFAAYCNVKNILQILHEYDPKQHKIITDKITRPDKLVSGADGANKLVLKARLALAIQKKIVKVAVGFLGNPTVEATPNGAVEENMLYAVLKTLEDNKIVYRNKDIFTKTKSERHSAELWYMQDADKEYWSDQVNGQYNLRMRVLAPSLGDELYPVYDDYGDMIGFGRWYKTLDLNNEVINHFDVYTKDEFYYSQNIGGVWQFADSTGAYTAGMKSLPNTVGKIPIVYYCQRLTDWEDVQPLIEALEVIISDHNDTNKYNGDPILLAYGKVVSMSNKGETGKLLELEENADAKYLTWDHAPESIKMEIENLWKFIHTLSQTPDISFENLKNLGYFTKNAMQAMFMDAHMKAADGEEIFGEGIQRRLNYLKTALASIDNSLNPAITLPIKPKFKYFLPENDTEDIANLVALVAAGLMSKQTAIELNPLVSDAVAELERIEEEAPEPPITETVKET